MKFVNLMAGDFDDALDVLMNEAPGGILYTSAVVDSGWYKYDIYAVTDFETVFSFISQSRLDALHDDGNMMFKLMGEDEFKDKMLAMFSLSKRFIGKLSLLPVPPMDVLNKKLHLGSFRVYLENVSYIDFEVDLAVAAVERGDGEYDGRMLVCTEDFVRYWDSLESGYLPGKLQYCGGGCKFLPAFLLDSYFVALLSKVPESREAMLWALKNALFNGILSNQSNDCDGYCTVEVNPTMFPVDVRGMQCSELRSVFRVDTSSMWSARGYAVAAVSDELML